MVKLLGIVFKAGVVMMCWGKIDTFLVNLPYQVTVTEAMDTINRPYKSKHKIPCGARDVRTRDLTKKQRDHIIYWAKQKGFKVIDEHNTKQPHIHIELR